MSILGKIGSTILNYATGGSMVGSLVDAGLSMLGVGQQNDYNMELAKYQNDYNTKMWHMQNEYNAPKATMARLTEAGINPRAYQQIGQFANSQAPQPAANMQKVSELSAFQGVVRQKLENDLLRTEIDQRKEQTEYTRTLDMLTAVRRTNEINKGDLVYLQAAVFAAENGLTPSDFLTQRLKQDESTGQWYDVLERQNSLQKMISTFNQRFDAKISGQELLNNLRNYESKTKQERYRLLENYGIDTEADSIMGAVRAMIRILEIAFGK